MKSWSQRVKESREVLRFGMQIAEEEVTCFCLSDHMVRNHGKMCQLKGFIGKKGFSRL